MKQYLRVIQLVKKSKILELIINNIIIVIIS